MTVKTLRVLPQAHADLLEVWLYVAEDHPTSADRLIDQFTARFDVLCRMPELGAACPEIADGLRRLPIGRYLLFYSVREDVLVIERVLHGARDLKALFE